MSLAFFLFVFLRFNTHSTRLDNSSFPRMSYSCPALLLGHASPSFQHEGPGRHFCFISTMLNAPEVIRIFWRRSYPGPGSCSVVWAEGIFLLMCSGSLTCAKKIRWLVCQLERLGPDIYLGSLASHVEPLCSGMHFAFVLFGRCHHHNLVLILFTFEFEGNCRQPGQQAWGQQCRWGLCNKFLLAGALVLLRSSIASRRTCTLGFFLAFCTSIQMMTAGIVRRKYTTWLPLMLFHLLRL